MSTFFLDAIDKEENLKKRYCRLMEKNKSLSSKNTIMNSATCSTKNREYGYPPPYAKCYSGYSCRV